MSSFIRAIRSMDSEISLFLLAAFVSQLLLALTMPKDNPEDYLDDDEEEFEEELRDTQTGPGPSPVRSDSGSSLPKRTSSTGSLPRRTGSVTGLARNSSSGMLERKGSGVGISTSSLAMGRLTGLATPATDDDLVDPERQREEQSRPPMKWSFYDPDDEEEEDEEEGVVEAGNYYDGDREIVEQAVKMVLSKPEVLEEPQFETDVTLPTGWDSFQ